MGTGGYYTLKNKQKKSPATEVTELFYQQKDVGNQSTC